MIKLKKLRDNGFELPKYQTKYSAGFDIQADLCGEAQLVMYPNDIVLIKTGWAMEIPQFSELQIRSRSGLALKQGIVVLNSPGTIDADFRQEVGIILINHSREIQVIKHGDRIAQGVVAPSAYTEFKLVSELSETDRKGGFGSTGK